MSGIPERLWNVVQGYWHLAQDRIDSTDAQAAAYAELAEQLKAAPVDPRVLKRAEKSHSLPSPSPDPRGGRDPLAVSYELLRVPPGIGLHELDEAYRARLAELKQSPPAPGAPPNTPDPRVPALEAAYEKLRDVLNPTETRFERIEF